jgi:glycosyltransferase 2 family protein
MSRAAVTIVHGAVSIGLIGWVLSGLSPSELIDRATKADAALLALAFSLHGTGLLLSALRWLTLLNIQKLQCSFKAAVLLYWIGCFFNTVLPTGLGGDVVRSYLASKQNGKFVDTAMSVIVERVAGVAALMVVFGVGVIWLRFFSAESSMWNLFHVSSAALVGFGCVLSTRKPVWQIASARLQLRDKFERIGHVLWTYRFDKRKLWPILLLSLLLQMNVIVYYYIIAAALELHLSFFHFCLFIPPILMLTMLPISVGGIGVREAAFLFFFARLGITPAEIVALSLWSYFLALVANLGGGFVYCLYRPASR